MTRNRSAAIRRLLKEAPSTGHEIANLLRISLCSAQVGLYVLQHQGHVRKSGRVIRLDEDGRKRRNLFELTDQGAQYPPRKLPVRATTVEGQPYAV